MSEPTDNLFNSQDENQQDLPELQSFELQPPESLAEEQQEEVQEEQQEEVQEEPPVNPAGKHPARPNPPRPTPEEMRKVRAVMNELIPALGPNCTYKVVRQEAAKRGVRPSDPVISEIRRKYFNRGDGYKGRLRNAKAAPKRPRLSKAKKKTSKVPSSSHPVPEPIVKPTLKPKPTAAPAAKSPHVVAVMTPTAVANAKSIAITGSGPVHWASDLEVMQRLQTMSMSVQGGLAKISQLVNLMMAIKKS